AYTINDCIPIQSDDVSQLVEWKNHNKLPNSSEPFQIRFEITKASLYGFYAGPDAKRFINDFTKELSGGANIKTIAKHLIKVRKNGGTTRALAIHYPYLNKEKGKKVF
ncbi:MAG: hypothetical protein J7L04_05720, partial [Bacteroidales bacterium]|nr:hypothetical protein [Bacteroidales bacterium]